MPFFQGAGRRRSSADESDARKSRPTMLSRLQLVWIGLDACVLACGVLTIVFSQTLQGQDPINHWFISDTNRHSKRDAR